MMAFDKQADQSDLRRALRACRASALYAGFFSLVVNLLMLVPSLYMLAVYDKVLTSGSEATLSMLTLIAVFLFLLLGGLEWTRSQLLTVIGTRLDELLGERVFDAVFSQALQSGGRKSGAQPLNDLLQLRQFLTGPGLFAFFDVPWIPLYVALLFLFHPAFGAAAVLSVVILAGLAVWNELATRADLDLANRESMEATQFTQRNLRNAEAIEAMGMLPDMRARWQARQRAMRVLQGRASAKAGLINALSKTYRLTIQSLALGLGAYLAIHQAITPGLVIAGSILLGRALAPLDLMIVGWRGFVSARGAYRRLDQLLQGTPLGAAAMPLPRPTGRLSAENLVVIPPGSGEPVLKGVSFVLAPGEQLAIIGPSAAGKSTLARALVGIYRPTRGSVRLDGAEIHHWDRQQLGRHLGYLPQDVELLDGTVGENIARFGQIDAEKVIQAAQSAGMHDSILRMPNAYDTPLLGGGPILSAGQQQRVALARALYGKPQFILLDEPNANLDQAGDAALSACLRNLKLEGCTVIVITHRPQILDQVDKILMLVDGQIACFGPRDQILGRLGALSKGGATVTPQAAGAAANSAALFPIA